MILEKINSIEDIKKLSPESLALLAEEVRQRMVEVVSHNGGHLASSLGAVELIIALHFCLNTPRDKIIFDVGHQAYAHKILTGRNNRFNTLRQYQGLSGFPCREESEFDVFTSGHSSNAVSQALGLACARDMLPVQDYFRVVAVIGDGSLSGGLCFEGLNNVGHLKKDILVILNTNELSIAPNVGAISVYLNKIISLPIYNRFRGNLESFINSRVPKGGRIIKLANRFEEGLKGLFIPGMLFEELGFRYFGPLDGHNLNVLIPTLKNILSFKGPRFLHIITKKGKGYPPAEIDPVRFHGVGSFNIKDGSPVCPDQPARKSYTRVFSEKLVELAAKDKKIVSITAAMPEGTGLDKFRDLYPARFFDVGIAEAHAVCFAAGLAAGGFKPVVALYSTFLQRAYDQVIEEVCLQNLPVVLCVDRAGIVGEDGKTHQGGFDINFLRGLPNLTIMAPADEEDLKRMLELALSLDKPVAIRYPRSQVPVSQISKTKLEMGKPEVLREGRGLAIFALGSQVQAAIDAADILAKENIFPTIINARFVKPLDDRAFKAATKNCQLVLTVEDGIASGGFGSALAEILDVEVAKIGLPDQFIPHGKRELLLSLYGLDAQGIANRAKKELLKNG
ncbi:MAG: 1-deoxy-D-xylulose-5-phosphate synthase [Candidatus Omnitrophica bacterium]|nr:1-deoxy-D-xylulose-5-phosphate synthase [Candidatus Omnitrophota bacterium]